MFEKKVPVAIFLAAVLAAASPGLAFADCKAKTAAFNSAVASKSVPDLLAAYNTINDDTACDFDIDEYRPRAMVALIDAAGDPAHAGDREAALQFVLTNIDIAGNWRLAEKLGDYFMKAGQGADALKWYEAGISFVDSRPATPASVSERRTLLERAAAAKIVASDDKEGHEPVKLAFSSRDLNGHIGGVYTPLLRGAEAAPVPLPINFVYAETTFTPTGQDAAKELAQALKEQNVQKLLLIGHADPRGSARANKILSLARAEAVKAYLLNNGVSAKIETEGDGADPEFDFSVLAYQPTQEERWTLDRRVEFFPKD